MQASKYERETDFTEQSSDETDHVALNKEFDGIAQSVNGLRDNLALIQQDDGKLATGIVIADNLAPDFLHDLIEEVAGNVSGIADEVAQQAQAATLAALSAKQSEASAATSAASALASRNASALNAQSANESATAAYASKNAADDAKTAAQSGAVTATTKAAETVVSANAATVSKDAAAVSATTASTKAAQAAASEANAGTSAAASAASKQAAALSESNAVTSAGAALASKTNAADSAALAASWAVYLGGPVAGGEYSARYWAGRASEAAQGAAVNIRFTPMGSVTSPNVQLAIQELDTKKASIADLSGAIPVGMRGEFYTSAAPDNWIKANGAAVPVASYGALALVIYCGDANNATAAWGYRCTSSATPSTTRSTTGAYIVLPDARGEYSRGWDDGRGIDAGRSLWSWQAGQVLSHTHTATQAAHSHPAGGTDGRLYPAPVKGLTDDFSYATGAAQPPITVTATGGTENLVRGLAALVCLKYK